MYQACAAYLTQLTKSIKQELRQHKVWRKWFYTYNHLPDVRALISTLGLKTFKWTSEEQESHACFLTTETNTNIHPIAAQKENTEVSLSEKACRQFIRTDEEMAKITCMLINTQLHPETHTEDEQVSLPEEARQHFRKADKEREELTRMLAGDSAIYGEMDKVMEQPVAVQPFLQQDKQFATTEDRAKYYTNVPTAEVLERISIKWRDKIMAATDKRLTNNGLVDEFRAQRMAAYMCQVDTSMFEHNEEGDKKRTKLYDHLLKHESFFNIDPINPPRFKGEPFDYVSLPPGAPPIRHQERRCPPAALAPVLKQVKEWLRAGIVEPSNSIHASPLLVVAKKALSAPLGEDGKPRLDYIPEKRYRTCVDYVQLNSRSEPTDISNAPRVEELLDYIGGADGSHTRPPKHGREYMVSTIDLYSGFMQWKLSDRVKPLTAFTVPGLAAKEGRLQFRVLPFGLASAPTRFNSLVASVLGDLRFGNIPYSDKEFQPDTKRTSPRRNVVQQTRQVCTNYIDDVYVAGVVTLDEHLDDMSQVFTRLTDAGFAARMDKAMFCRPSIAMLGWEVGQGYRCADDEKIKKIRGLSEEARDVKDILTLLGTIGFYRPLIPQAGDIEAPLYNLTRKGAFENESSWTNVHRAAVRQLKMILESQVKLAIPKFGLDPETGEKYPPFQLATDASGYSGGCCLSQCQKDGSERPICYASKAFTKEQRNWSASERELWTLMYFATEHFKHYFAFNEFVLFTDHKPLTYLFAKQRSTNAKLARWASRLSQIRAKVEYRCGVDMGPADLFSRLESSRPSYQQMEEETPENRTPSCVDRGTLAPFENTDPPTGEPRLQPHEERRKLGLPMQRLSFLQGEGRAHTSTTPRTDPIADPTAAQIEEAINQEVVNQLITGKTPDTPLYTIGETIPTECYRRLK